MIEKIRKFAGNISAVVLLVFAGLGIIYETVHRFAPTFLPVSPEEALIFLVSLLCGSLGIERLTTLRTIEANIESASTDRKNIFDEVKQISGKLGKLIGYVRDVKRREGDIINAVDKINSVEVLLGTKAVEDAACLLIEDCDDRAQVKATSQYHIVEGLSNNYLKKVANRVKRAKDNRGDMEYHVILSADMPSEKALQEREEAFKCAGVEDRLVVRYAKQPWPFEVLIGGHSMIIALLGGANRPTYDLAIRIKDPEFVEKASNWFGEVIWGVGRKP
jgi:hypothetical protein